MQSYVLVIVLIVHIYVTQCNGNDMEIKGDKVSHKGLLFELAPS